MKHYYFEEVKVMLFGVFLHALSLDKPEVENFQRSKYVKQCVRTAN